MEYISEELKSLYSEGITVELARIEFMKLALRYLRLGVNDNDSK